MEKLQGMLRFTSGLPQAESLQRVGLLLEDVASMQQNQGKYAESLALRLLSLQVCYAEGTPPPLSPGGVEQELFMLVL